ncbi:nuclease-related domain-containing protein [Actinomadura harenae]|uniref:NERD domain-containing protein n=1 Tax=Actinomadura harenae TaxID=2483351 RepID=A0A3M2M9Z5_9ACTN|nr:nuclease-related domain-containing protein [Actinomadura harenae]RMI45890.1 NERD domain-containing protein [Actinomadura harenae]
MAITERSNGQQARGQPDPAAQQRPPEGDPAAGPPGHGPVEEPPGPRSFGGILADPTIRPWLQRGVVALVVLALVWVASSLLLGLVAAALVVVGDVVRRNRTASTVEAWQKASAVERKTERQLRSLEKNGYRVLHARAVPRDDDGVSDGRIDHLVIGPSGVYAIDSEAWDKRLPVRTLSHRKLFHGPFNKKDRLDETAWEAGLASKIISEQVGFEVPVQGSVAIYGPSIPWKVMRVRDVDVYAGNRARGYLRRRPRILTVTDVERIFEAAEESLPPKYPDSD